MLIVGLVIWPLVISSALASGDYLPHADVAINSRQVDCSASCDFICNSTEDPNCYCSQAVQQGALACTACGFSAGKPLTELQSFLDDIVKWCASVGFTVPHLVVPTALASSGLPLTTTPTMTSTSPTVTQATSTSTLPTSLTAQTSTGHGNMGLIVGVTVGAILATLGAALGLWFFCVRRNRKRTPKLDLSEGEDPHESKALTSVMSPAISYSPATDTKSAYAWTATRSHSETATRTATLSDGERLDSIPLLDVYPVGSGPDTGESAPASPSVADARSWASLQHGSELSDGRPFMTAKAPSSRSRTNDGRIGSIQDDDVDRIAARVARMLAGPNHSTGDQAAPPSYER